MTTRPALPQRRALALLALVALALCAFGCATGRQRVADLAGAAGFSPLRLETQAFVLRGWLKPGQGPVLFAYIEGDGLAWLRRGRPSSDPTPGNPVGLGLALADPARGPVLYLARPCQFTEGPDRRGCTVDDWTGGRFSARAVAALDAALSQAKAMARAERVALHGFSGGGAMAALLAARRTDVVFLGTVAGNLDHRLWTSHHGDTPLAGSLNPVDSAAATKAIPQLHVIGGKDTILPRSVLDSWCARLPGSQVERVILPEADHDGPWDVAWPELLRRHRRL